MQMYYFRCPDCSARNRIPYEKVGTAATCGKCGSTLDTSVLSNREPVIVTDADFSRLVLASPLPVLLDCWAPWCGPCQMVGPVMAQLAGEWQGRIRVAKLNTEDNPVTASAYSIRSVPTMLVFDNGQLKETMVGALPKPQIQQKMAAYLK